jgi:hypothetical protein
MMPGLLGAVAAGSQVPLVADTGLPVTTDLQLEYDIIKQAENQAYSDGDFVDSLFNQAGTGVNTATRSGAQPQYDASEFGGAGSLGIPVLTTAFAVPDATFLNNADHTIFVVFVADAIGAELFGPDSGDTGDLVYTIQNDGSGAYGVWGSSPLTSPASTHTAGTASVVTLLTESGVEWFERLNGVEVAQSGSPVVPSGVDDFTLFARDGGPADMEGEFGALLIYDRALTTAEIADVETYLADRYNITF